jgi:hypothetical protein
LGTDDADMGMSGRELIEAKDKWEKLAMGARPFHVVCDSIEALEDQSRDGDILGGWFRESWKSV